jgi:hypothetical protein
MLPLSIATNLPARVFSTLGPIICYETEVTDCECTSLQSKVTEQSLRFFLHAQSGNMEKTVKVETSSISWSCGIHAPLLTMLEHSATQNRRS